MVLFASVLVLTQEFPMNSIGIDLHKESISVCVMSPERQLLTRRRMACKDPAGMVAFFQTWSPFQGVMEATSSCAWLLRLLEPMAERVVLAHPQKLRMIAERRWSRLHCRWKRSRWCDSAMSAACRTRRGRIILERDGHRSDEE